MLLEKLLTPLKDPGKILRIIRDLCFDTTTDEVTMRHNHRSVASPEACPHKELRTNYKESPPKSGPVRFTRE
jgi:hypothetical protein